MKKLLFILLSILFLSCANTEVRVEKDNKLQSLREYQVEKLTGPKKKVAVASFRNETRFGKRRLGNSVADVMTTELSKTGRYILLERGDIDKVLEEVKFSNSALSKNSLGKIELLNADYIITGAVSKYSVTTTGQKGILSQKKTQTAEVAIDLKILDVKSGEVVLADFGEGKAERVSGKTLGVGSSVGYDETLEADAFRASVINLMENIIKSIDGSEWSARGVKLSGKKLYINSGKKSNLKIGEFLEIYNLGEEIYDTNGKFLGREEMLVGNGTVSSYFGEDASVVELLEDIEVKLPAIVKLKE